MSNIQSTVEGLLSSDKDLCKKLLSVKDQDDLSSVWSLLPQYSNISAEFMDFSLGEYGFLGKSGCRTLSNVIEFFDNDESVFIKLYGYTYSPSDNKYLSYQVLNAKEVIASSIWFGVPVPERVNRLVVDGKLGTYLELILDNELVLKDLLECADNLASCRENILTPLGIGVDLVYQEFNDELDSESYSILRFSEGEDCKYVKVYGHLDYCDGELDIENITYKFVRPLANLPMFVKE